MTTSRETKRNTKHVEAFLDWLRKVEKEGIADAQHLWVSEWYESELFVCYARIGMAPEGLRDDSLGLPTICLSNINISSTENRGRGLFTLLIGELTRGAEGLSYTRIECEEVMNPRLRNWLARHGFRAYEIATRTYYLDIQRS